MEDNANPRLDAEWVTVNAVRELLRFATHGNSSESTYDKALHLGGEIAPQILGPDVSLLRRNRVSRTIEEYKQRAIATSLQMGQTVSALELLDKDIANLTVLLEVARGKEKTNRLKNKLIHLQRVRIELVPVAHSENQLIIRDIYNVQRNLPELNLGQGHKDFRLSGGSVLRIRMLHPENVEAISGADVIYERHFPQVMKASLVAVQYKIWDNKRLYISEKRLQSQLHKMEKIFCGHGLCNASDSESRFRFPYCSAFLRPTDRLQSPDQTLMSSGEHVPICEIEGVKATGARGGEMITYESVKPIALSYQVFEGLFTSGKVGSRTITYDELREVYVQFGSAFSDDRVVIHAQGVEDLGE